LRFIFIFTAPVRGANPQETLLRLLIKDKSVVRVLILLKIVLRLSYEQVKPVQTAGLSTKGLAQLCVRLKERLFEASVLAKYEYHCAVLFVPVALANK
jgi:hypothetical protein